MSFLPKLESLSVKENPEQHLDSKKQWIDHIELSDDPAAWQNSIELPEHLSDRAVAHMETPFRSTAAHETSVQENLPKSTFLESGKTKTEVEKAEVPENSETPENQACSTDVDDTIMDDNGKICESDGKPYPNQVDCLNGCKESTKEVENERMSPPIKVTFLCKDKYDSDEFQRQVANQEKGMNKLTLYDYQKNRASYKENGRNNEVGSPAQEKARQEAYQDRVTENRRNGMSRQDAETEAKNWIESQAALHDPDQIAGGDAANVTGMGDKDINSSIGSQWQYRIDAVDQMVQDYIDANNLSEDDLKRIYINVDLEVACGE